MKRASLCPEIITQNTFFNNPVQKKDPQDESYPAAQARLTRAITRAFIPYYNALRGKSHYIRTIIFSFCTKNLAYMRIIEVK